MTADYYAYSWYFGGAESHLGTFNLTPFGEEYTGTVPGDVLAYNQSANLTFNKWALFPGTDPHAGLILVNNSDFGSTSRGGATAATEGLLLPK
jgi:hypothetical protein